MNVLLSNLTMKINKFNKEQQEKQVIVICIKLE